MLPFGLINLLLQTLTFTLMNVTGLLVISMNHSNITIFLLSVAICSVAIVAILSSRQPSPTVSLANFADPNQLYKQPLGVPVQKIGLNSNLTLPAMTFTSQLQPQVNSGEKSD